MIAVYSTTNGVQCVHRGVEAVLVHYVQSYGQITSLDAWAHEWGLAPYWVRICAHRAARQGLVKLTRLPNASGRPYRVTCKEEDV
jgi:hypothetical protein